MTGYALASAALFSLAALVPSHTCQAQFGAPSGPSTRPLRIGFAGGVSVPVSDAKSAFKNGIAGQGFILLQLPGLPALRATLGLQKFDFKQEVFGGIGNELDASSTIVSGLANVQVNLLSGPVRPYILAGLGAFNVKTDVEGESASEVKFGIDGGAGLALRIGRIDAFVEGRIQNIYTDEGTIDFKSIRTVPVTFGIIF